VGDDCVHHLHALSSSVPILYSCSFHGDVDQGRHQARGKVEKLVQVCGKIRNLRQSGKVVACFIICHILF